MVLVPGAAAGADCLDHGGGGGLGVVEVEARIPNPFVVHVPPTGLRETRQHFGYREERTGGRSPDRTSGIADRGGRDSAALDEDRIRSAPNIG